MNENIILRNNPKTEFQLLDNGFRLVDGRRVRNNGFYSYDDVQSIEFNKVWYIRLLKWLRYSTWLLNGAPLVGETSNKANLVINTKKTKIKILLTEFDMADKAQRFVALLNKKLKT